MAGGGGLVPYGANVFDQRRAEVLPVMSIARRSSGAGPDQVQAGDQCEDRKGTRSRNSGDTARWRGRQGRN